ncbi:hypothetical protein OAG71_03900 [bacterium]|nr:hypothetical protein [bacterium]
MPQLEHITAIEKRLWSAADNLRANSNYASNEYFLLGKLLKQSSSNDKIFGHKIVN